MSKKLEQELIKALTKENNLLKEMNAINDVIISKQQTLIKEQETLIEKTRTFIEGLKVTLSK
jgi:hypothetical protein